MISYIIPTRDRPEQLALTLAALGRLSREDHERIGGAEVIVVDNASRFPPTPPTTLGNGISVRLIPRPANEAAAGRNIAAQAAGGEWLVMLDDDSHPLDSGFIHELMVAPPDVAAIGAEIFVPDPSGIPGALIHESGGLPEVFIGCGVAIRRDDFLNAGGYDPTFHYYAEEYDLSAKLMLAGKRITHSRAFRVMHHKVASGRDMNTILRRLVRNNAWVEQRYAPLAVRREALNRVLSRYRRIAEKEQATDGYDLGLLDLDDTLEHQPRQEMSGDLYDRFTGLAAARAVFTQLLRGSGITRVALIESGKNDWAVRQVLRELGVETVTDERQAQARVIGTLSPGPILDSLSRHFGAASPVIAPWIFPHQPVPHRAAA